MADNPGPLSDPCFFRYEDDHDFRAKGIVQSFKHQWNSPDLKRFLILKISFVVVFLILLIINATWNLIHYSDGVDCLRDILQEWTEPITLYFKDHDTARNVFIATCTFLLDLNMILAAIRWFFYADSLRLILVIICFYIIRGLVQRVFFLAYPENFIFIDPGVFSPSVPYFPANDFFWSGHVGICYMFYLEFRKDRVLFFECLGITALLANMFCLLITRAHYTIDLACGVMFSHYFYRIAIWIEARYSTPDKAEQKPNGKYFAELNEEKDPLMKDDS